MRKLTIAGGLLFIGASVFAAVCREYGCTKYAYPNGWCELHQEQGRIFRARKAAEAAADREILRNHDALVRQHDAEDAAVKAAEAQHLRHLEAQQRRQLKAEQEKFGQPLEGLFGRRFGEKAPTGESAFVPAETFRGFTGYVVRSDGTNGVVRISASADFADMSAARRERDAVLADFGVLYGRTPHKLYTKNGDDVRALGFGGVDGMARQQLQVTLVPKKEGGGRIDIVGFVIRRPQCVLLSEAERD